MDAQEIIFIDLDGTLINSQDRWYRLHLDLSVKFSYCPLSKKAYISSKIKKGIKEEEIMKGTNIRLGNIFDYTKQRVEIIENIEYLKEDKVKPGVYEFLDRKKDSYYLVLVTKRKNKENCLEQLDWTNLKQYFDQVKIAEGFSKDLIVNEVLAEFQNPKGILIGDTEDDLIVARKTNMKCILVCDGVKSREYLSNLKPDYLFDTISDVKIPESF